MTQFCKVKMFVHFNQIQNPNHQSRAVYVRALRYQCSMSSTQGGWRVVLVANLKLIPILQRKSEYFHNLGTSEILLSNSIVKFYCQKITQCSQPGNRFVKARRDPTTANGQTIGSLGNVVSMDDIAIRLFGTKCQQYFA